MALWDRNLRLWVDIVTSKMLQGANLATLVFFVVYRFIYGDEVGRQGGRSVQANAVLQYVNLFDWPFSYGDKTTDRPPSPLALAPFIFIRRWSLFPRTTSLSSWMFSLPSSTKIDHPKRYKDRSLGTSLDRPHLWTAVRHNSPRHNLTNKC